MINPTPLNIPLERMALLGRDAAYYNTYLGPFPEKAIIVNVAAGVSYFPRAQIAVDPIYDTPISQIKQDGLKALVPLFRDLMRTESTNHDEYFCMLQNTLHKFCESVVTETTTQYETQSLPWIKDIKGDLVLCSHFIFTYDLGLYGTMACIANLMDIAPEGRIYPYCADQIPAIAHFMPHLTFEPTPTYLKITHAHES